MRTGLGFLVKLFIGVAIFVGLPLLGWGMMDIQGFVSHPARLGYIVLVVLLQLFVAIKFPGVGGTGGAGTKIVQRQRPVVFLMQVIPLALVILAPYSDHQNLAVLAEMDIVRYLGLGLDALGFILMNWAEASLGKQFSVQVTIQEDHRLVTEGLFRYLRHPRYLGILLFTTGICLVYRSGLALVLVALLALVLLWRIHDEEALMRREFEAAWVAYSKKTWRLVPFVY